MNFTKNTPFQKFFLAIAAFLLIFTTFAFIVNPVHSGAQASPALTSLAVNATDEEVQQEVINAAQELAAEKQVAEQELLATIEEWLGVPYRLGGQTKKGTDCSGFVLSVYEDVFDLTLNRTANAQFQNVTPIGKDELKVGDLIFFKRAKGPIFHVGIYVGDNTFAHAPSGGARKVTYNQLDEPYYANHFYSAGRVTA